MLARKRPTNLQLKNADDVTVLLTTARLHLIIPSSQYASAMVNFLCRNRLHFKETFPAEPKHYTEKFWQQAFGHTKTFLHNKQSLYLLLTCKDEPKNIIGNISFDGIIRGALHAGYLGFKIGKNYEHQGLMHEALESVIPLLFHEWRMHRIMANYRIGNTDSEHLLKKLGFQQEGLAKDYLYINGQWHDHVLTSLINRFWQV